MSLYQSNSCGNGTGLFYVYAKNINDDWSYRYLITFATRDVADTWFRKVTESVQNGYQRFKSVNRVSLQFFTHNPSEGNIPDTITDPQVAQDLRGKIFFTLLNDRDGRILSIIPVLSYPENLSGNRFYVRSISQPDTYWWYDPVKAVVVASKDRRTLFTITLADTKRALGATMIGSDDVFLTTDTGINIGSINHHDQLGNSKNPFPVRFASFQGDFQISYYNGDGEDYKFGSVGIVSRNPGKGERWELA